ncbi:DUF5642 family protein [Mycobacterium sp. 1274756.6]|uniref:DUF5642 family protein n=1 Tax=Mycobacterium sp. 1274756.6 TaxID=1834076 RepID=UPI0007FD9853|nr:DUF5642 family protein [Mycobacterium sp. 1274756.6]OBJ67955.1 hypothetical protein A5643_15845 [Mycobacterium sp. 1274756.6]
MNRPGRWIAAVAALTIGCTTGPPPVAAPSPEAAPPPGPIHPADIRRVVGLLPEGYEHNDTADLASPAGIWGLGPAAVADPPDCAALADPAGARDPAARGVSGSGAGGIVYAVVAPAAPPDPALTGRCATWRMTFARTTIDVELIDAPHIDGVPTVGMTSRGATLVEGGGEIDSLAYTFTAYLDGYRAVTAAVVDPGAPQPQLDAGYAADLLVRAVAELRGAAHPVG